MPPTMSAAITTTMPGVAAAPLHTAPAAAAALRPGRLYTAPHPPPALFSCARVSVARRGFDLRPLTRAGRTCTHPCRARDVPVPLHGTPATCSIKVAQAKREPLPCLSRAGAPPPPPPTTTLPCSRFGRNFLATYLVEGLGATCFLRFFFFFFFFFSLLLTLNWR
uniref:Uncharacterized protein n=1 Tax=Oryza meridionalis TaxID=40149 RepID=A0A0E0D4T7_9ORYZ